MGCSLENVFAMSAHEWCRFWHKRDAQTQQSSKILNIFHQMQSFVMMRGSATTQTMNKVGSLSRVQNFQSYLCFTTCINCSVTITNERYVGTNPHLQLNNSPPPHQFVQHSAYPPKADSWTKLCRVSYSHYHSSTKNICWKRLTSIQTACRQI